MKAVILLCLLLSAASFGQPSKMPEKLPATAGELKQFCKSYQLMAIELETGKKPDWKEVNEGSICLAFIIGVYSTVAAQDVGYFPEFKYVQHQKGNVSYKDFVASFMKHVAAHPGHKSEGAAGVVLFALMEDGFIVPRKWENTKK